MEVTFVVCVVWRFCCLRPFIIAEDRRFVEVIEIADEKLHVVSANKEYFDKTVWRLEQVDPSHPRGRCQNLFWRPTSISVLPFVVNFKYILEDMDEDAGYIWTFKEVLWCEIEERCRNNLNFHILKKARFFEVQFHIIPLKAKVWQVSPPRNIYKESDQRQNCWLGESSWGENDAKWVRCWWC